MRHAKVTTAPRCRGERRNAHRYGRGSLHSRDNRAGSWILAGNPGNSVMEMEQHAFHSWGSYIDPRWRSPAIHGIGQTRFLGSAKPENSAHRVGGKSKRTRL